MHPTKTTPLISARIFRVAALTALIFVILALPALFLQLYAQLEGSRDSFAGSLQAASLLILAVDVVASVWIAATSLYALRR
jgi:hypothetical protein